MRGGIDKILEETRGCEWKQREKIGNIKSLIYTDMQIFPITF